MHSGTTHLCPALPSLLRALRMLHCALGRGFAEAWSSILRRCKGHLHYASDNGLPLLSGQLNQSVPAEESTYTVTTYRVYPILQTALQRKH